MSVRLLWAMPAVAGLLVAVDLVGWAQVALLGAEAAFPDPGERARVNTEWLDAADPTLWLVTVAVPLLLVTGLLAVAGWRLRGTHGLTLTAVGALTAACLPLILWGYGTTPLAMMVFCQRCDAGALEQVPGPVWFRPTRGVVLAVLLACLVTALWLLARTPAPAGGAGTPGPRGARVTAVAALVATGAGVLILAANVLGLADGFADPRVDQASSDPDWLLRQARTEAFQAARWVALVMLPHLVATGLVSRPLWRGRVGRPPLVLLTGGFGAAYGFGGFGVALIGNPLAWGNGVDLHMVELDVPWYPVVLLLTVLAGVAAHLVLLVGLLRRTTAGWLAKPPA